MSPPKKTPSSEIDEVYQIRLANELKSKFMRSCHEMALNPSAVMRMLMTDWTERNSQDDRRPKSS